MSRIFNVLFLCTGNSARSILAEAMINDPGIGSGRFRGYSAGSHPKGTVHPLAIEWLEEANIATSGLRSKSWAEFAEAGAPPLDFIITVCDNAANEVCPVWPGRPIAAHWGVPDPAGVDGADQVRRRAFADAALALRSRIERLADLPLERLEGDALQSELDAIGRT